MHGRGHRRHQGAAQMKTLVDMATEAMAKVDDYYVSRDQAIAVIDIIRNETLEEAAKVTDDYHSYRFNTSKQIAAAIREMKGKSDE